MSTMSPNNNGTTKPEPVTSPASNANGTAANSTQPESAPLDTPLSQGDLLPEALKSALSGDLGDPERQRRYAERLLYHTFDQRDTDAAKIIAQRMDADPQLDAAIADILGTQLQVQPDAVYLFVRARLSGGLDARWLNRLRAAAVFSLRVAVNDGDPETILNWLKLIAREPANYGMTDILHQGILAAQPRASVSGVLGQALLALSVKRDPAALETLLNDAALINALPDALRAALTNSEGDTGADAALTVLETCGPELFLLVLAQAANREKGVLFTPEAIDQLWSLYSSGSCVHLHEDYRPISIINRCVEDGANWLDTDSLRALLLHILSSEDEVEKSDELFRELIHHLRDHIALSDLLESALQTALESGERTPDNALDLVGGPLASGDISEHQAVSIYVGLLTALDWDAEALPLMEQLARTLLQEPDVEISRDVQWRLLRAASELKVELLAKVASKRLLAELDTVEDEAELCEHLMRLFNRLQWNNHLRQQVLSWWRDYVRKQPMPRLQRFDRALEGERTLDEAHVIVQTTLAFRKMLGRRSLQNFAADVATAFNVLEALSDSFDPSPKHTTGFDAETMRTEIDSRESELTPHERKIFANNLKDLAEMVASLGDNRSKANLMRRSDDVDRQLMTGEQQPHSAVDTLKWMSGYLDGAQDDAEDSDE